MKAGKSEPVVAAEGRAKDHTLSHALYAAPQSNTWDPKEISTEWKSGVDFER
jgi:hypothetical protein